MNKKINLWSVIGKIFSKKLLISLSVVALAAGGGAYTYSRYSSSATQNVTANVAKWAIKINDADITGGNATLNVNFQKKANDNVVEGKIAPGSELYADFEIDPTGSEVAIEYSFELGEITAISGNVPGGLTVTKVCTVKDNAETEVSVTGDKYTGTIPLSSQNAAMTSSDKVTVRVYVGWTNNDNNNTADTAAGRTPASLKMTVTGIAQQKI